MAIPLPGVWELHNDGWFFAHYECLDSFALISPTSTDGSFRLVNQWGFNIGFANRHRANSDRWMIALNKPIDTDQSIEQEVTG